MFGRLPFLHRRRPQGLVEEESLDVKPPPAKKAKTVHDKNGNDEGRGESNDDKTDEALALMRDCVFLNQHLLQHVVSFVDAHGELQLAAVCRKFFVFFHERAGVRLDTIIAEADPNQQDSFLERIIDRAYTALSPKDCQRLSNVDKKPSWLESWVTWWRGEQPHRTWEPYRNYLQCAYTVPADLQEGMRFGPSCSYRNCLYCLAARGAVITYDAEPKMVGANYTCIPEVNSLSNGYDFNLDNMWYCAPNDDNRNNKKGYLVLRHQQFPLSRPPSFRIMDLSQTNQDVGRGEGKPGINQTLVAPSDRFYPEDGSGFRGEVVVSEHDALVFFVGMFDGAMFIESYDMNSRLVASTCKTVGAGAASPQYIFTHSVVTKGKLVVVLYSEQSRQDNTDYGLGIYAFDCRDLSFCEYTPLFSTDGMYSPRMSEDWMFYVLEGKQEHAVEIKGGKVWQPVMIDLGDTCNVLLVAGKYLYASNYPTPRDHEGNPNEHERNIEIAQFDLSTGSKIRTLKTSIPWSFQDDGSAHLPLAGANNGRPRRLRRMIANAHIVGNKVVFLLTSQGSHKNSIVAFVLPPEQM